LSQIQWRFLGGISGKNYSRRIFQKFCANQGYSLSKLVKFRPNFWNFIVGPYCAEKNSHKHFRMLFAPRLGSTSINEWQKEDTGKKILDVWFSENRFCSLSVWDLLRLTPWVFWSKIFTRLSSLCLLSFCWGLTPDSSHKIGNTFFIRHCQGWKEASSVCETVWFFWWVNTHPLDLKFVAFCPKFSGDSWVEFQEKNISEEFLRNFVKTNAILYRNLWNSGLISAISLWVRIALKKNSHKHFRMLFAPRQGSTSINESQKEDTGKKSQNVLFSENRFCSLSDWDLLRLTPLVFWSEIFTRHSSLCLLSFGWGLSPRFVPQDWQ